MFKKFGLELIFENNVEYGEFHLELNGIGLFA